MNSNNKGLTEDWNCSCGYDNYSSRSSCLKCNKPRSNVHVRNIKPGASESRSGSTSMFGDWFCSCGGHNFATRSRCHMCDKIKDTPVTNINPKKSNIVSAPIPMREELSDVDDKTACKICFERVISTRIPCGHICMCMVCASAIKACPICRALLS